MTTINKLFIIILLCLISFASFGAKPNKYSLLWEITKPGINHPSYLFGTMHSNNKIVFNLDDSVFFALKNSGIFANEINLDSLNPLTLISHLTFKDSNSMAKLISKKSYNKMDSLFKVNLGYSAKLFDRFKPIYHYLVLSLGNLNSKDGKISTVPFLDQALYQYELKRKKRIVGLETAEGQIKLLADIPLQNQVMLLNNALNQTNSASEDMEDLAYQYINADFPSLEASIVKQKADTLFNIDFEENMVNKRNLTMLNSIMEFDKQASTFSAVGVAHLVGEKGLISLLRQRGYNVRPIKSLNKLSPEKVIKMLLN
jgi:uncharacterized protein YbaP (TraB family)